MINILFVVHLTLHNFAGEVAFTVVIHYSSSTGNILIIGEN